MICGAICFLFSIFPDMWVTGPHYLEQIVHCAPPPPPSLTAYPYHSVLHPSTAQHSLCGFPQPTALLLLVDTVSVDVKAGKTCLKETDWEMMMSGVSWKVM